MTSNLCLASDAQEHQRGSTRTARIAAFAFLICILFLPCAMAMPHERPKAPESTAPTKDYLVYVVCESADKIALVRFGAQGLRVEHETHIGLMPMDINGPHGIAVSPDKQFLYVSVGHGRPGGSVWKLRTGTDQVIRYTSLGLFPATTDI